jgi:hypothetical protein
MSDEIIASAIPLPEESHKGPHVKSPHNPDEINPKMISDIVFWSKEFGVSHDLLHEAIRTHGTRRQGPRSARQARSQLDLRSSIRRRSDHQPWERHEIYSGKVTKHPSQPAIIDPEIKQESRPNAGISCRDPLYQVQT